MSVACIHLHLKRPSMAIHNLDTLSQAFTSDRAGISIADYLADETGLSKSKIKQVMKVGGVWRKQVDAEPARIHRFSENVRLEDEVHIYFDESILSIPPARLSEIENLDAFAIYEKGDEFLTEASLFCDHLSFDRALERDLPKDLPIHLVLSDEPNLFGLVIVCFSKVAASKISELAERHELTANFSFFCKESQRAAVEGVLPMACFEKVQDGYKCRFTNALITISEQIESLEKVLEPEEKRPFICCDTLVFICPLTQRPLSFHSTMLP